MELQTIFNMVTGHLLRQKRGSLDSGRRCMYRGDYGTKCAVGYLIPDKYYNPHFEHSNINDDAVQDALACGFLNEAITDGQVSLLDWLQRVHDEQLGAGTKEELATWAQHMLRAAERFNLIPMKELRELAHDPSGMPQR